MLTRERRLELINYLSMGGHKERNDLLVHLVSVHGMFLGSDETMKRSINKWVEQNKPCEAGIARFRDAFPTLIDPERAKRVKVKFTVEVEMHHECGNFNSGILQKMLESGAREWDPNCVEIHKPTFEVERA